MMLLVEGSSIKIKRQEEKNMRQGTLIAVKEMDTNSMTSLLKGTSSILKTVLSMKKR